MSWRLLDPDGAERVRGASALDCVRWLARESNASVVALLLAGWRIERAPAPPLPNGSFAPHEYAAARGLSARQTQSELAALVAAGVLRREGYGRGTRYSRADAAESEDDR